MQSRAAPPKAQEIQRASAVDPALVRSVLEGQGTERKIRAGQIVYRQGDAADAVFYVIGGTIKLVVTSETGREGVIAPVPPGDFFGERCLAHRPVRFATASALIESSVIRIERATMKRLLHDNPSFSEKFTAYLVARTAQVEADLVDQLFNSTEKRLARILLLLANFNDEGDLHLVPKISQKLLAARVGTTRANISHFMSKFRRLGLIEYNGQIRVSRGLLDIILHE